MRLNGLPVLLCPQCSVRCVVHLGWLIKTLKNIKIIINIRHGQMGAKGQGARKLSSLTDDSGGPSEHQSQPDLSSICILFINILLLLLLYVYLQCENV